MGEADNRHDIKSFHVVISTVENMVQDGGVEMPGGCFSWGRQGKSALT